MKLTGTEQVIALFVALHRRAPDTIGLKHYQVR